MLNAYIYANGRLEILPPAEPISKADWIDILRPTAVQEAAVRALGVDVPSLADLEEIEVSNRLYHEGDADYLTVVLPGHDVQLHDKSDGQIMGPVCFILRKHSIITVRHHAPRAFETYPPRADKSSVGCSSPDRIFLGLIEEVIGRLADHLETAGRGLDDVARSIYNPGPRGHQQKDLENALSKLGSEGERLSRVRLALLTLGRALNYVDQLLNHRLTAEGLGLVLKGQVRDIDALEVHADFLSSRLALASDATLGTINLTQSSTVRIVSVVAVFFLPPTLIASIYGMNFVYMPELTQTWGYPLALALMIGSAALTWAVFRLKGWL